MHHLLETTYSVYPNSPNSAPLKFGGDILAALVKFVDHWVLNFSPSKLGDELKMLHSVFP